MPGQAGQDKKMLLILIHVFVLLPNLQQPLKHIHTLKFQLPGIHQLLVVLPPRAHVTLLRNKFGGFAVIGFEEVDGFLPFGQPEFVLGHGMIWRYSRMSCLSLLRGRSRNWEGMDSVPKSMR